MRDAHDVATVRAAEAELMAALPDGTLMQRAAAGLAAVCADLLEPGLRGAGRRADRQRRQRRRRALRRGPAGPARRAAYSRSLPGRPGPRGRARRALRGVGRPRRRPAPTRRRALRSCRADLVLDGISASAARAACGSRTPSLAARPRARRDRGRGRPAQRHRRRHRRGRRARGPRRRHRHLRHVEARAARRSRRRARRRGRAGRHRPGTAPAARPTSCSAQAADVAALLPVAHRRLRQVPPGRHRRRLRQRAASPARPCCPSAAPSAAARGWSGSSPPSRRWRSCGSGGRRP